MVAPGLLSADAAGTPCPVALPQVLLDGVVRDRCPYAGDQAVTGRTLLESTPSADGVLRDMILWYASHQLPDGAIPASPDSGGTQVFFDYNAFWVQDLHDYVLYTGDLALAREAWPVLVRLLDDWYPAQAGASGLLVNTLGPFDYGYIPRAGTTVAYYNAGYVLALRQGVDVARWLGQGAAAVAWTARIAPVAAAFQNAFWDPRAGAYLDATSGPPVHPEDGNAFAILAGLAPLRRGRSALDYLTYHDSQPYGATIADNETWDGYPWGFQASRRSYPFMAYFEVLARYAAGFDISALELIRREWGWMLEHGPGTMWETIGAGGSAPVGPNPSWDHGWSSGAAPALTDYVLGVTPASPGFGAYLAQPHPSGLFWAHGVVPTPHGPISFGWSRDGRQWTVRVSSPVPGTVVVPGGAPIPVAAGTHTLKVGA